LSYIFCGGFGLVEQSVYVLVFQTLLLEVLDLSVACGASNGIIAEELTGDIVEVRRGSFGCWRIVLLSRERLGLVVGVIHCCRKGVCVLSILGWTAENKK
jgi:hypothetical protein